MTRRRWTSGDTAKAQEILNTQSGIGLKAQRAAADVNRASGIAHLASNAADAAAVRTYLGEPVKNFTASAVGDTLKKNLSFLNTAGISAKVRRKSEHKCCEWCSRLAGVYTYPDVPGEIFQRHENCRCTVVYDGKKLKAYKSKDGKENTFREGEASEKERRIEADKNIELYKRSKYYSTADPMAEVFGPAEVSNPNEVKKFIKELKEYGVELIRREKEDLAYAPGLKKGEPGQAHISVGASYSAWCHEMQHVRDDRDAGWAGYEWLITNPEKAYENEERAYQVEINLAEKAGKKEIAEILRKNLLEERNEWGL